MHFRKQIELKLDRDHPDDYIATYSPHTLRIVREDEQRFATLTIEEAASSTNYYIPLEELVKALKFLTED